jgi:hypothetical protein
MAIERGIDKNANKSGKKSGKVQIQIANNQNFIQAVAVKK